MASPTTVFVVIIVFLTILSAAKATGTVKIGLMLPLYGEGGPYQPIGRTVPGAFDLAVQHVNEKNVINGYTLEWSWKNTNCSTDNALIDIMEFWEDGYFGIVGPGCSCVHEGRVASSVYMPMIAYMCNDDGVYDKEVFEFPTFFRATPHGSTVASPIVTLYQEMGWKVTSIIASDDQIYQSTYYTVKTLFDSNSINIMNYRSFNSSFKPDNGDVSPFLDIITETAVTTRIYLFLGRQPHLQQFAIDMENEGLLKGDYLIIGVSIDFQLRNSQDYTDTGVNSEITRQAFKSVLIVELQQPAMNNTELESYIAVIRNRSAETFGIDNTLT
ncbi:resact receptor-like, partial [Saccoglossus kowalevskii]|uniref:Resact receptor-like n=1 Tax=Saccoglossus kowalevskii TaxID=10224 RepID=A0ABM0MPI1_SACKO